jgi:hypothetical protein
MDDLRSGALRDHSGVSRAYSAICVVLVADESLDDVTFRRQP